MKCQKPLLSYILKSGGRFPSRDFFISCVQFNLESQCLSGFAGFFSFLGWCLYVHENLMYNENTNRAASDDPLTPDDFEPNWGYADKEVCVAA